MGWGVEGGVKETPRREQPSFELHAALDVGGLGQARVDISLAAALLLPLR